METFIYYAISICYDGKILAREVTKKIEDAQIEAWHYDLTTLGEVVKRWDAIGQSMKKHRYFLISKDRRIF